MKLKLNWVTDIIGEEYKNWEPGDIILIESQTGTGKTHFIKDILIPYIFREYKNMLFVCNRINLKRQIKRDLLKQYGKEIPSTLEELDKISRIEGRLEPSWISISSYQSLQEDVLNHRYFEKEMGSLNRSVWYSYIVLDECHYLFADSGFNNKTNIALGSLVNYYHPNAIKIFMTATMDEVIEPIKEYAEKIRPVAEKYLLGGERKLNIRTYSTGRDYSYINPQYFKNIHDITALIKNDRSDDKWIVFVSNLDKGKKLQRELGNDSVFISAGTEHEELDCIIHHSKFNRKVLITTKTLDNGIDIKDHAVKNIVIMVWDKITFLQMLGRRRVDINHADLLNLYIPMQYKKSFYTLLTSYQKKLEEIQLCKENPNEFNRKYDTNIKALGEYQELFYRDKETKEWTVNPSGEARLLNDKHFAESMIQKFEEDGEFAFVKEQLSWMGLEDTFDENRLIKNSVSDTEHENLETYLNKLYTSHIIMLTREDRQELIERINVRDGNNRNRLLKSIDTLNSKLKEVGSQFVIKKFETSKMIDGKKHNYKNAWRIEKRNISQ